MPTPMPLAADSDHATRAQCLALDAADPLATLRDRFIVPDGTIYLDGNSLGAMPRATAARVADVITREWGRDLIKSWNTAGWIATPRRLGDLLAPLIGAKTDEVIVADSTSVNLFKVLTVAMRIAMADDTRRKIVVSEDDNFPTDLYIAEGVVDQCGDGASLTLVPATSSEERAQAIVAALGATTAVLMLTHVNYRSGAMHDMKALTRIAHEAGVLVIWDLAHSAGAVPVDLYEADADFAIGCGYKYLNGGPGAPAFLWVHPRHVERFRQPLSGWMGHAAPFAFVSGYAPAAGVERFLCGTPPILSMAALECGIASLLADDGSNPMPALRAKSIALTDLFIELVEARCGDTLLLATPRDPALRGSQVSFHARGALAGHGYATMQALIHRGVIGDFRKGRPVDKDDDGMHDDILRFGFTPAYLRYVDVMDAVDIIVDVIENGAFREARFNVRAAVT
jgi:kynureninase